MGRLLDKNPATRLTWHQLSSHAFWKEPIALLTLPQEHALAAFISRHSLEPAGKVPFVVYQDQHFCRRWKGCGSSGRCIKDVRLVYRYIVHTYCACYLLAFAAVWLLF